MNLESIQSELQKTGLDRSQRVRRGTWRTYVGSRDGSSLKPITPAGSDLIAPGQIHGLSEGNGTTVHVQRLSIRCLLDHLPPGPR